MARSESREVPRGTHPTHLKSAVMELLRGRSDADASVALRGRFTYLDGSQIRGIIREARDALRRGKEFAVKTTPGDLKMQELSGDFSRKTVDVRAQVELLNRDGSTTFRTFKARIDGEKTKDELLELVEAAIESWEVKYDLVSASSPTVVYATW